VAVANTTIHTVLTDKGIRFTNMVHLPPDLRPRLRRPRPRTSADQDEAPLHQQPGRANEPHD
jgi:hypothetical protein